MHCLCGKTMLLFMEVAQPFEGKLKLWACPPEGCGRIYLEGKGAEINGTFYFAEQNDRKEKL
jgi:hypothetical protein